MKKISKLIFVLVCFALTACNSEKPITHLSENIQNTTISSANIEVTKNESVGYSSPVDKMKITNEAKKLTGKSFIYYTQNYTKFFAFYCACDTGLITIREVKFDCQEDQQEVCDMAPLHIMGPKDWDKPGIQTFYFSRSAGEDDYFGPFQDDLQRIIKEAKVVRYIKDGGEF